MSESERSFLMMIESCFLEENRFTHVKKS
jgi:hypothetical protein